MKTTTIRIEEDLLVELGGIGTTIGVSLNRMIQITVEKYLADYRRASIDAEFAEMANDPAYQKEALEICEAFKYADADLGSR